MNGLSWLIYGSEVAGNLRVAAIIGLAAGGVVGFIMPPKGAEWFEAPPFGGFTRRGPWLAIAAAAALLVAVPSKNTIMLIAASQVGETVLASKDVQAIGGEAGALATDSLKLLRKYVTEQLGEADE